MKTKKIKTSVFTKDLTINGLYDEFIKEYTVVMIETTHEDICFAYEYNKRNTSWHDFNRTILVVDRDADFESINKTINDNLEAVHKIYNSREETTDIFSQLYIYFVAKTSQYWDDVRYFFYDTRTYLACDSFEYDILCVNHPT